MEKSEEEQRGPWPFLQEAATAKCGRRCARVHLRRPLSSRFVRIVPMINLKFCFLFSNHPQLYSDVQQFKELKCHDFGQISRGK